MTGKTGGRVVGLAIVLIVAFLIVAVDAARRSLDRTDAGSPPAQGTVLAPADRVEPPARAATTPAAVMVTEPTAPTPLDGYAAAAGSGLSPTVETPEPKASPRQCRAALAHMRTLMATTDSERRALARPSLRSRVAHICASISLPRRIARCLSVATSEPMLAACRPPAVLPRAPGAPELTALRDQATELGLEWPAVPTRRDIDREVARALSQR